MDPTILVESCLVVVENPKEAGEYCRACHQATFVLGGDISFRFAVSHRIWTLCVVLEAVFERGYSTARVDEGGVGFQRLKGGGGGAAMGIKSEI